jgi:hypothetical protein
MRDFFLAGLPIHEKSEAHPQALLGLAMASDDLGVGFIGL